MRAMIGVVCALSAQLMATGCNAPQQVSTSSNTDDSFDVLTTPIGAIEFATTCDVEASQLIERGVGLTHHMMYDEANFVFGMARNTDPDCAMANWGLAMTIINPLWPKTPSDEQLQLGVELIEDARAKEASPRERAYLDTTAAYFIGGTERTEAERLQRFQSAWEAVYTAYPDDIDAEAFFLLSTLATANPNDRSLSEQRRVAENLDALLSREPNHPGALHYYIHANDYPELAEQALSVADHYGEITPKVPHATHMMTHIYTRLGQWDRAITWNNVSAESALSICRETGTINGHYTHALDYLAYAYLQIGNDVAVMEILDTADTLRPPYSGSLHPSAYAFSAIPARFALERKDWNAASQLSPQSPSDFPWNGAFEPYIAITHFARAMGLARSGQTDRIDTELSRLAELRDNVSQTNSYWSQQIEIQRQTAEAWQMFALGQSEQALSAMHAAADLSLTTEKHPITPGEVLPTLELLGDMLLENKQYDDAIAAYEQSLKRSPKRLNTLYGAARAAELSGQIEVATTYYRKVGKLAQGDEVTRLAVLEAREWLTEHD